jgi:hypothetical protein
VGQSIEGEAANFMGVMFAALGGYSCFYLLGMLGSFLCLTAPPEVRGRDLVMATLFLDAIAVLVYVLQFLTVTGVILPSWKDTVFQSAALPYGLVLIGRLLFASFLARLASHLQRGDVARRAWAAVRGGGLALTLAGAAFVILIACRGMNPAPTGVIAVGVALELGAAGLLLRALYFFLRAVVQLRGTIAGFPCSPEKCAVA